MGDLSNRFPNLFYDIATVVEKTPKAELPSMSQVLASVLSENGIQNQSLASSLAQAAEQLVALRNAQPAKK